MDEPRAREEAAASLSRLRQCRDAAIDNARPGVPLWCCRARNCVAIRTLRSRGSEDLHLPLLCIVPWSIISGLMARRVPFIGAELGDDVEPFMLHIYASLAQKERSLISHGARRHSVTIGEILRRSQ